VLVAALILLRFGRGAAWVALVVALALLVLGMRGMTKQYARARKAAEILTPPLVEAPRHIVIVPLGGLNQPTLRCLTYARSITPEVRAVCVAMNEGRAAAVRAEWRDWVVAHRVLGERAAVAERATVGEQVAASGIDEKLRHPSAVALSPQPRLVVIESPAYVVFPPLLAYIATTRAHNLDATITVIVPVYVPAHWWERMLFDWTAYRLRSALYHIPQVVVTCMPYSSPK
jgi:hypothetical protein